MLTALAPPLEPLTYRKTPGSFPPGAVVQANFTLIRRSGIEVAMDAELTHERTLVREGADSGRLAGRAAGLKHVCGRATISRLQLLVHNVDAHGSLRVHVPLGPRTDVPHLPVVVAGAGKAIG